MLVGCICRAQATAKKDSLLKLFSAAKDDSLKVILLIKVSSAYATSNFDSSLLYLQKAEALAKEKKVTACDPAINTGFSQYYYYNNDYQKSKEYALKNLAIAEKNDDDQLRAKTYNNLSAIYNYFGNYKSAIDYVLKCIALSEKVKDSASFPVRNLTASTTYYHLKQYDKSIIYSKKAIAFGKQFNNPFVIMMGLNNLAGGYSAQHKTDTAIGIYLQQLDFARQEEDIVITCYALINLCNNYFTNNNQAGVEKYSAMLDKIALDMPDKRAIAEIYNVNALRYILRKDYLSAKVELDSGIALAKREDADALGNLYQTYSKLYFIQNKIKEAEDYSYKYDSLQAAATLKELNFYTEDMEVKYETEKKEAQIKLQQASIRQKNTLNYILLGSAAALTIILLMGYRNYRHKQKLQKAKIAELETEKQLLATQSLLKGQEDERSRLAKDLHDGLGGLLSGVKLQLGAMKGNLILTEANGAMFNNALNKLDESIAEMRRVAHNMMPEALLRLGLKQALQDYFDNINVAGPFVINTEFYGLEKRLDTDVEISVYRTIQELVNNAIKHSEAKNILVQVMRQGRSLNFTVEDNGKGFDVAAAERMNTAGLQSIRSRVNYLNGKMDIRSQPGKGTSVYIECIIEDNG